jgi:membrane associated rhomboid family serine protease
MTGPPGPERPADDRDGDPFADLRLRSGGRGSAWRLKRPQSQPTSDPLLRDGPLTREQALGLLDRARYLMEHGENRDAARHYQRVIGFDDAAVTAAAFLGIGTALQRLDFENEALAAWEQVTKLPETPSTYPAWRNVAAARVRLGNDRGALAAYREAERRAPPEDKAEIASRLGWLSKQTGDQRAAGRYFARARGVDGIYVTYVIIGMTIVVSLLADPSISPEGEFLTGQLALDKVAVAHGEWWRLLTIALVHAPLLVMPLHVLSNMYALWITGPLVEQLYGRFVFVAFYLACAIAGSIATFAFGEARGGVGASGAIFGLFGIVFVSARRHHPVLDQRGRMFVGQIGGLIALNLIIGFALSGIIDNWGHIGGLLAGGWLGFLIPPGRVQTFRSMLRRPSGSPSPIDLAARIVGIIALVAVLAAGYWLGVQEWL